MVCVIDDAHWLDPASAGALLFCASRLGADRVAMVYAARDDAAATFEAPGVAELVLTGLGPDASRTLLGVHLEDAPVEDVTRRLIAETGGNPLALLELPTELTAAQLQGHSPLPAQLHLTARVEQVFLDRSRRLSADVQTMLLLAAADDTGEVAVLRRAARSLGLDEDALVAAVASGLLVEDGPVVAVRHPLVRSAIYQAATGEEPTARPSSAGGGPVRKRRPRPADLAPRRRRRRAGRRAGRRPRAGRVAGAATRRSRRGPRGLRASGEPGDRPRAASPSDARGGQERVGVRTGGPLPDPAVRGARRRRRSGSVVGHRPSAGPRRGQHRLGGRGAPDLRGGGRGRPRGGPRARPRQRRRSSADPHLRRRQRHPAPRRRRPGDAARRRLAPDALPQAAADRRDPRRRGQLVGRPRCLDLALRTGERVDDRDVLWNLGNAALQLGDDDAQQRFYGYALARAREAGAVTAVVYCLQRLCFCSYLAGDLVAARSIAEEAIALAEGIGQPALTALPVGFLTLLAAVQGRDDYDELLLRLEGLATTYPLGILTDPVHDLTRWAKGARAASDGDSVGALHHLSRFRLPVFARMSAPERIESAVRADESGPGSGLRGGAGALRRGDRPAMGPRHGRLRAGDDGRSGRRGVVVPGGAGAARAARRPLDAARTELAYGEWLRRNQRRVDARQHLRQALETFQDVHAEALAARANQELRASGETARKRDPSTLVDLTPMELKIAQLVSSGLSNKDVAAQCWISPRTVAFHLRNVFAKAGVTSRGELAQLELG